MAEVRKHGVCSERNIMDSLANLGDFLTANRLPGGPGASAVLSNLLPKVKTKVGRRKI